jgi:Kef-type K+ transport system membrane component KefB
MDDVVGLVMVNIVTSLGGGASGAWPIARPIVASFGLLLVTLCTTSFILQPAWERLSTVAAGIDIGNMSNRPATRDALLRSRFLILIRSAPHLSFILSILVLLAFITIASFIDASVLFAAFLAGGVLSHIWSCGSPEATTSGGVIIFDQYYRPLMDHLLVPFFFVSSPPFVHFSNYNH